MLLNMIGNGERITYYNTNYPDGEFANFSYQQNTSANKSTSSAWVTYVTGPRGTYNVIATGSGWWEDCVHVDSKIPGIGKAKDVKIGSTLQLANNSLEETTGIVTVSHTKQAKGFRIVTESGASLVCSDSAPIQTKTVCLTPDKLLGVEVAVKVNGIKGWSVVKSVVPVGVIDVQHITVGDRCFWAGETDDAYILHHNQKMGDQTWLYVSWNTNQSYLTETIWSAGESTSWNTSTTWSTTVTNWVWQSWNTPVQTSRLTYN